MESLIKLLDTASARYDSLLPDQLRALDELRYESIPKAVTARDERHMLKSELVQLVQWKLKHGKFRPNLLKLAESNDPSTVKDVTTDAFAKVREADAHDFETAVKSAVKQLSTLKGIGPATASLVLSCAFDTVPFFSDEYFRLLHCASESNGASSSRAKNPWDRKIGYSLSEYHSLLTKVTRLQQQIRLLDANLSVSDVERAAWVLGKEGEDLGAHLESVKSLEDVVEDDNVEQKNVAKRQRSVPAVGDQESSDKKGRKRAKR